MPVTVNQMNMTTIRLISGVAKMSPKKTELMYVFIELQSLLIEVKD